MSKFWRNHALFPAIVFGFTAFLFESFQWDLIIGDFLYKLEGGNGGEWPLKHNFFTETILHTGGKYFSMLLGIIVLYLLALSFKKEKYYHLKRPLIFIILSTVLPLITVSLLKSWTHVDCPWDLLRYGGENPYVAIFDAHPGTFEFNRGFPASHSCSAFMWVCLYFFFLVVNPKYCKHGLIFGLVLGALYGLGQQLRGAHFLSHDLWSLAICWFYACFFFYILLFKKVQDATK